MPSNTVSTATDGNGSYIEQTVDTPASIEVTRSAKGQYQWSIKVYCEITEDGMRQAANIIKVVDDQLRQQYAGQLSG